MFSLNGRVRTIEQEVVVLKEKVETLEELSRDIRSTLVRLESKLDSKIDSLESKIDSKINSLESKVDLISKDVSELKTDYTAKQTVIKSFWGLCKFVITVGTSAGIIKLIDFLF